MSQADGRRIARSSLATAPSSRAQGGVRGSMPHQLWMRLTCLEMERHRRGIERDAAQQRVDYCVKRCDEIQNEMSTIKDELRRRSLLDEASGRESGARVNRASHGAVTPPPVDESEPRRSSTRSAPMPFKY